MDSFLKIIQCNIQSLDKHKIELQRTLSVYDYDVALLSETWTKLELETTSKYRISNYHHLLHSRPDNYGGAAVFLKNNFAFYTLALPAVSDYTQAVAMKIISTNIVIVSIYVSPSVPNNVFEDDLTRILNCLRQHKKVVIGGDLNAHHYVWGNENTDRRGEILMNLISNENMILLNDGSSTYVPLQMNRNPTAIDITISTASVFPDTSWKVLDFGIGSHHMAIETRIELDKRIKTIKYFYNNKSINQDLNRLDGTDVQGVRDLQNNVQRICKMHRTKDNRTPKIWWSDTVEAAWKEKTEARRQFNRLANEQNLIEFKRKAAIFQRAKRTEITKKLQELPEQINPFMGSKELWQKIGYLTGRRTFRKENNIIHESREEAEKFLDLHFGKTEFRREERYGLVTRNNLINTNSWIDILNRKKRRSAPGEDRITYEMLRNLSAEATGNIIYDLNKMWMSSSLSEEMKTIKIVAIPKPGRDQNTAAGKRPISLVPTITKVANTAVLEKLQVFIENNNVLPRTSFGFRQGMSTTTCLSYVLNSIKQNKRDGYVTTLICIDLSNAFNAVSIDKMEELLFSMDVPIEIICWILSFLRNRRITMRLKTGSVSRTVSNGLPQGDVLSPTLFNLYTVELHNISNKDVIVAQYADDFGLIVRAPSLQMLNAKVQTCLDKFSEIAETLNFQINAEKTKAILFMNNDKSLQVTIKGNPIDTVRIHKYLGITFDRYLSFGAQIREIRSKVNDRLNMLKVICGIKHGSHPQVVGRIYIALIRSLMEYGCLVTNNTGKTNRQMLTVSNNQCLRKTTGCTRSTPLNALAAIAGQDPLDIRFEYATGKNIARCFVRENVVMEQLKSLPEEIRDDGSFAYMERIYSKNRELFNNIMPMCTLPDTTQVEVNSTLEGITGPKNKQSIRVLKQAALYAMNGKFKGRGKIFTDASKQNTDCGIGIYIEEMKRRFTFKLKHEVSITSAELQALRIATKLIAEYKLDHYVIYTDSMTACNMLNDVLETRKGETLLVEILNEAQRWNVSIQWIPSHIGLAGNDIADQLAKNGLSPNAEIMTHNLLLLDMFLILNRQRQELTKVWFEEYSKEKGKHFTQFQSYYHDKPWYTNKNLKGNQIRLLNRLITGHNYSKEWLAKIKIVEDANCESCGVPETADHIVLHCPRFDTTRTEFSFGGKYTNLIEAFKTKNITIYREIAQFVEKCKIDL